ncbi:MULTISPECIES: response regulator transcription factor [Aliiglaciecola]|uniref:response regulator transcription factor n=1 Tax=Aliiglaciecola TaxID=1406885 RepID=UPI001C0828C7|nr:MULTISPECIES: response regulator transcription factor [Aliiglaciecola]MBU2876830.1 response regulator transcription factor [Aliiglaciecola lipolytica]MDO6711933.1 response regulator transcription factor [Aliiglaciecola sp. 2_MG-2023]MDO6753093.1 response regulator transcription factor [Aliiglaciecola sp. 1_MG-2023]
MAKNKSNLSVLLIEDNLAIAKQVAGFLEAQNWIIDCATLGKQGLDLALQHHFDLIVLDLNLPDIDGLVVCDEIKRTADRNIPILMLTARDAFEDKAKGFGIGADDYLTKPFDLRELVLRCEALARRPQLHGETLLQKGMLSIDSRAHKATFNNLELTTTGIGFRILQKLVEEYPYPVSRSELIRHLWGDEPPESNALKSHIYGLRKSFEKVTDKPVLCTISNIGYQLQALDD